MICYRSKLLQIVVDRAVAKLDVWTSQAVVASTADHEANYIGFMHFGGSQCKFKGAFAHTM